MENHEENRKLITMIRDKKLLSNLEKSLFVSFRKHLFCRTPAQSWTPVMAKITNTNININITCPSNGNVPNKIFVSILKP